MLECLTLTNDSPGFKNPQLTSYCSLVPRVLFLRPCNPHSLTVRFAVWDANSWSHGFLTVDQKASKLPNNSRRYEGISRNLFSINSQIHQNLFVREMVAMLGSVSSCGCLGVPAILTTTKRLWAPRHPWLETEPKYQPHSNKTLVH